MSNLNVDILNNQSCSLKFKPKHQCSYFLAYWSCLYLLMTSCPLFSRTAAMSWSQKAPSPWWTCADRLLQWHKNEELSTLRTKTNLLPLTYYVDQHWLEVRQTITVGFRLNRRLWLSAWSTFEKQKLVIPKKGAVTPSARKHREVHLHLRLRWNRTVDRFVHYVNCACPSVSLCRCCSWWRCVWH